MHFFQKNWNKIRSSVSEPWNISLALTLQKGRKTLNFSFLLSLQWQETNGNGRGHFIYKWLADNFCKITVWPQQLPIGIRLLKNKWNFSLWGLGHNCLTVDQNNKHKNRKQEWAEARFEVVPHLKKNVATLQKSWSAVILISGLLVLCPLFTCC